MAEVLLASMAEVAGESWTPEVAAAWAAALDLVATAMLEGAGEAEARQPCAAAHRRASGRACVAAAAPPWSAGRSAQKLEFRGAGYR